MKTIRTQLARGYARWARYLTTMEGAEVLVVSSGIPFHLWRLYQHFWLVCLLFPIVSLPMRSAFVAVVIFTLLPLGISAGASGGIARVDWLQIIPLMLLVRGIGVDMIGAARLSGAIRELQAAREELAHLAVIEERQR